MCSTYISCMCLRVLPTAQPLFLILLNTRQLVSIYSYTINNICTCVNYCMNMSYIKSYSIVRKGSVVAVGMLSTQISPSNLFFSLDNSNLSHGLLPFVYGILLCSLSFITYGVTQLLVQNGKLRLHC